MTEALAAIVSVHISIQNASVVGLNPTPGTQVFFENNCSGELYCVPLSFCCVALPWHYLEWYIHVHVHVHTRTCAFMHNLFFHCWRLGFLEMRMLKQTGHLLLL